MGGGYHSTEDYNDRVAAKKAAGKTTFDYSDLTRAKPASARAAHPSMDPKIKAGPTSPYAGQVMRESRDSADHPESVAIVVVLDVTGSMQRVITTIHTKIPELYGLLLRKGYCADPQILYIGVGDAYSDRVPLQAGQFESDNRADANLEDLFIEGGGGGTAQESYALAAYFVNRHTSADCWEKRAHRGYCFFIGDEMAYDNTERRHIAEHIGGDDVESPINTSSLFASMAEKWDTYFVFPLDASHGSDKRIPAFWRPILGQNFLELERADAVAEVIALTVGLGEGTVDLSTAEDDLRDAGVDAGTIEAARKALVPVGAGAAAPATASGDLPDLGAGGGVDRL